MSHNHLSNNLEKIIQLISIEQLMGLMKQMKNTTNINIEEPEIITPPINTNMPSSQIQSQLEQINSTLLLIVDKIGSIESEIQLLKQSKQTLDDNCDCDFDEEHIKLKIEEKEIFVKEDIVVDILNMNIDIEENVEENVEQDVEDMETFISKIDEVIAKLDENDDQLEDDQLEDDQLEDDQLEDDQLEDDQSVISEAVEVKVVEDEVEEEVVDDTEEEISDEEVAEEEVVAVVNLEEDEEVFEIEIDDVTYFATHEENGILYEVDENGEPGKKVGIIKDGEPIFS